MRAVEHEGDTVTDTSSGGKQAAALGERELHKKAKT
jgi:hypothetical protein